MALVSHRIDFFVVSIYLISFLWRRGVFVEKFETFMVYDVVLLIKAMILGVRKLQLSQDFLAVGWVVG